MYFQIIDLHEEIAWFSALLDKDTTDYLIFFFKSAHLKIQGFQRTLTNVCLSLCCHAYFLFLSDITY